MKFIFFKRCIFLVLLCIVLSCKKTNTPQIPVNGKEYFDIIVYDQSMNIINQFLMDDLSVVYKPNYEMSGPFDSIKNILLFPYLLICGDCETDSSYFSESFYLYTIPSLNIFFINKGLISQNNYINIDSLQRLLNSTDTFRFIENSKLENLKLNFASSISFKHIIYNPKYKRLYCDTVNGYYASGVDNQTGSYGVFNIENLGSDYLKNSILYNKALNGDVFVKLYKSKTEFYYVKLNYRFLISN